MKFYGYADNGQQVWFAVPTNRNGSWEAVRVNGQIVSVPGFVR